MLTYRPGQNQTTLAEIAVERAAFYEERMKSQGFDASPEQLRLFSRLSYDYVNIRIILVSDIAGLREAC